MPRSSNSNSNSNSSICSAPPTISPMAHSIVSGRSVLSWTAMSLGDACMLLSMTAWVSVPSATDSTHGARRQRTHGLQLPLSSWTKEVAVAGGAQRRACWYVGDRCEQIGDVVWCVADECFVNEQTQLGQQGWSIFHMVSNVGRSFVCFITIHAFDRRTDIWLMGNTACRDR